MQMTDIAYLMKKNKPLIKITSSISRALLNISYYWNL